jgi:hypothetical protein
MHVWTWKLIVDRSSYYKYSTCLQEVTESCMGFRPYAVDRQCRSSLGLRPTLRATQRAINRSSISAALRYGAASSCCNEKQSRKSMARRPFHRALLRWPGRSIYRRAPPHMLLLHRPATQVNNRGSTADFPSALRIESRPGPAQVRLGYAESDADMRQGEQG